MTTLCSENSNIDIFVGTQTLNIPIDESIYFKIININSTPHYLFKSCNCENIYIFDVYYNEEYNNVEGVYDNIFYNFQLIWNNDKRTYFLNDIHNENYETNIIGNITTETSTKEKNTCFLKGETFISYVFKNTITFKKLIDDCF